MPRFHTVLFDLDGTLVDTNHLIITSFQHTLREKLGLEVSAEELTRYFGEPLVETLARFDAARKLELTDFYREFNVAKHDELIRPFPGVEEMLEALTSAGVRIAVVTSKMEHTAWRGLRVFGLDRFFTVLVGPEATTEHKPSAAPALHGLKLLGAEPGDGVLMVGDSHFDVGCGRNAGCRTAAVGWSTVDREMLKAAQPDFWVETPAQLAELVLAEK